MSQEKPVTSDVTTHEQEPIKYGDVFSVSGELASKPIAPDDASMMQAAETMTFGQTQKGGPASAMQSAATHNEQAGLVGHRDTSDVAGEYGVTVAQTDVPGARIITEFVGGQAIAQVIEPKPMVQTEGNLRSFQQGAITIGEALEVTARTAGDKPVDQSDAAAIQAAEVRATGSNLITPGGVAASAQSAALHNARTESYEDKIKLGDILGGAASKLPADKVATRHDAEGIVSAEMRNSPDIATHHHGVAEAVAAAARLNENPVRLDENPIV